MLAIDRLLDKEGETMNYIEIMKEWNDIADGYNQWDSLGEDEKVEFSFRLGFRSYPNIEKKEKVEKEKLEVDLIQSNECQLPLG